MNGRLRRFGNRDHLSVPPEALQFVISARLLRKYVDQAIPVVRQHPFGIGEAFDTDRIFAAQLHLLRDLFRDGLNLFRIRAGADHEKVGERGYFAQVQYANVDRFFGFSGADGSQPRRGFKRRGNRFNCGVQLLSNSAPESPYSYGTLKFPMRQSAVVLLCFSSVALLAQTPQAALEANANKRIDLAQKDLDKVRELVGMGALARVKLTEAEQNLGDAQDDAVLARTLYSDLPAKDWTEQMAEEGVAAAERRVQRQQERVEQTQKLVDQGFVAQSALAPLQEELTTRQTKLDLARLQARQLNNLASLAKLEESIVQSEEASRSSQSDPVLEGMEHFEGNGQFQEARDLMPIEIAFELKFDRELPISADGETGLHRALGLDHRGRVDVAVDPNTPEGIWLRTYLKSRDIPYYAFTHAMPGKATGAHIHIGPGSTRLSQAD